MKIEPEKEEELINYISPELIEEIYIVLYVKQPPTEVGGCLRMII